MSLLTIRIIPPYHFGGIKRHLAQAVVLIVDPARIGEHLLTPSLVVIVFIRLEGTYC